MVGQRHNMGWNYLELHTHAQVELEGLESNDGINIDTPVAELYCIKGTLTLVGAWIHNTQTLSPY